MPPTKRLKHLSTIANDVVYRCSLKLGTPIDELVDDFEVVWNQEQGSYSRKLVEFCSAKALRDAGCGSIGKSAADENSFSRFTFDVMLAWQMPSYGDEGAHAECLGKEQEDDHKVVQPHEDASLFYSDIMPLLVDHEPSVQEDAFVWFSSMVPLAGDVVNARFTFETLTSPTADRLHFPAYDKYLNEIDKCVKHLQKQTAPSGVELAEDEFILHVEGAAGSQRVVRHIGGTSWPGRLTLTNYALYFEANGAVNYEDALKISLSDNTDQSIKPTVTGPWGAPLFDKAVIYQSSELPEGVVLEFPEMASSTRRDHWLALTQEIMLLHKFLSKHKLQSLAKESWEMQARTILGIIRLHAAREMLRMAPPVPKSFLIFTLLDELPKGDYILEELAETLKQVVASGQQPCGASTILQSLNMVVDVLDDGDTRDELGSPSGDLGVEMGVEGVVRDEDEKVKVVQEEDEKGKVVSNEVDELAVVDDAILEARKEEKEIEVAKATTDAVKEEGVGDSALVFLELLKPLRKVQVWCQNVLTWEKPSTTVTVLGIMLLVVYKEWIGKAVAVALLWVAYEILQARKKRVMDRYNKVVVYTKTDQTAAESIVSAQHGLRNAYEWLQIANIIILKLQSIFLSRVERHADVVVAAMAAIALVLAIIPVRYIIMVVVISVFASTSTSKFRKVRSSNDSSTSHRRLKEWWDSIPIVPVQIIDDFPPPEKI